MARNSWGSRGSTCKYLAYIMSMFRSHTYTANESVLGQVEMYKKLS